VALDDFAFPETSWRPFVGKDVDLTLEVEFIEEK
jgi:hypothetical protein